VKYSSNDEKIASLVRAISNPAANTQATDADMKFIDRVNFSNPDLAEAHSVDIMMLNNLIRILRFQAIRKDSTLQDVDPYVIENKFIKEVFTDTRFRAKLMAYNLYSRILDYTQYPMQLAQVDGFITEFKKEHFTEGLLPPIETLYKRQLSTIGSLVKGAPAPNFKLPDLNGKQVSLSDFKGKVVYIDLWASWCGPCLTEMPYLKKLKEKFEGKNIELVSISIDTKKEKWLSKIAALKLDGVQLIDSIGSENSRIAKDYKIHGVPHYVLIDKNGKIASSFAPRPSEAAEVEKAINALL
jgi:thiol-disulfide isomerase/thioredoxin